MKNETIKTYTEINKSQAFKLAGDGEKLCFGVNALVGWTNPVELESISLYSTKPFKTHSGNSFKYCATVTELDPCVAPEGCPELEPWMAYVGDGATHSSITGCSGEFTSLYFQVDGKWHQGIYFNMPSETYAIDVRTAWSQEHFPEHCRIRNYKELDPCTAPEGCPELEPWMAYVGTGTSDSHKMHYGYVPSHSTSEWIPVEGSLVGLAYAIDVRTAWAQEHFPEHCRIRNYQDPDIFNEYAKKTGVIFYDAEDEAINREFFELGQANPKK